MTILSCSRALLAASFLALILLVSVTATGQTPRIDDKTPLDSLKAYCDKGNTDAMIEYGGRMLQGNGITADTVQGITLLRKAAASGNTQAWYQLGVVYANNFGVKTNLATAMDYFRKGAKERNADCQASLGLFYQAGERIPGGVKADPAEARKWYLMAAEQGQEEAILHLAQLLISGQGGNADPEAGAKWLRKGAEMGSPESQWSLGGCYLMGRGVGQDSLQAYALWDAAVDGIGNADQKKAMGERRDALGKNLSPDQIANASRLSAEWKAKRR